MALFIIVCVHAYVYTVLQCGRTSTSPTQQHMTGESLSTQHSVLSVCLSDVLTVPWVIISTIEYFNL